MMIDHLQDQLRLLAESHADLRERQLDHHAAVTTSIAELRAELRITHGELCTRVDTLVSSQGDRMRESLRIAEVVTYLERDLDRRREATRLRNATFKWLGAMLAGVGTLFAIAQAIAQWRNL